jgi:hypothetical protein
MDHEHELVLDKGLSMKRGLNKINVVAVHYILLGDEGEPRRRPNRQRSDCHLQYINNAMYVETLKSKYLAVGVCTFQG